VSGPLVSMKVRGNWWGVPTAIQETGKRAMGKGKVHFSGGWQRGHHDSTKGCTETAISSFKGKKPKEGGRVLQKVINKNPEDM